MRKAQPALHSEEYRVFRAILVAARLQSGMTQQALADVLKRHQSFVAKIESGERRVDVTEFVKISRAMRADPKKLFLKYLASVST